MKEFKKKTVGCLKGICQSKILKETHRRSRCWIIESLYDGCIIKSVLFNGKRKDIRRLLTLNLPNEEKRQLVELRKFKDVSFLRNDFEEIIKLLGGTVNFDFCEILFKFISIYKRKIRKILFTLNKLNILNSSFVSFYVRKNIYILNMCEGVEYVALKELDRKHYLEFLYGPNFDLESNIIDDLLYYIILNANKDCYILTNLVNIFCENYKNNFDDVRQLYCIHMYMCEFLRYLIRMKIGKKEIIEITIDNIIYFCYCKWIENILE